MALERMDFDECAYGPRREVIAQHIETGRTISASVPAAWTDVETRDVLEPEYTVVVKVCGYPYCYCAGTPETECMDRRRS